MGFEKPQKWKSKKYLAWIRKQPCFLGRSGEVVPHHFRKGTDGGTGTKPSDSYCLPVNQPDHQLIHAGKVSIPNETAYRECLRLITKYLCENAVK